MFLVIVLTIILTSIGAVCIYWHHLKETSASMLIFAPETVTFGQDGVHLSQEEIVTRNLLLATSMMTQPESTSINHHRFSSKRSEPNKSNILMATQILKQPTTSQLPPTSPLNISTSHQMPSSQNLFPTPVPHTNPFQSIDCPVSPPTAHPPSDRMPFITSPTQDGSPQPNQCQPLPYFQPSQRVSPSETMSSQRSFDPNAGAWYLAHRLQKTEEASNQTSYSINTQQQQRQRLSPTSHVHHDIVISTNDFPSSGSSQPETFISARFNLDIPENTSRVTWESPLTREEDTSPKMSAMAQIQEFGNTGRPSTTTISMTMSSSVPSQEDDAGSQRKPDCMEVKLDCDIKDINVIREDVEEEPWEDAEEEFWEDVEEESSEDEDYYSDEDECTRNKFHKEY